MNMSNFNRKSQLSWEKTQTVDRKGKKNVMLALSKQQNWTIKNIEKNSLLDKRILGYRSK